MEPTGWYNPLRTIHVMKPMMDLLKLEARGTRLPVRRVNCNRKVPETSDLRLFVHFPLSD